MRSFLSVCLCGLVAAGAGATETDSFTERHHPMPEVTDALNRRTNELLDNALDEANAPSAPALFAEVLPGEPPCSRRRLYEAINRSMGGPLVGTLEEFANRSSSLPQRKLTRRESIYHAFGIFETPSMGGDKGRLAAVINIGGNLIGADKLGHFFSQGYSYFERAQAEAGGLESALDYGDLTERTYYGALLTGVYSYADLTANFNGMRFWAALLKERSDPLGDDGRGPYFTCTNGRWARVREFDWRDYVDPAWDEAVNCSLFRNEGLQAKVQEAIGELERRYGESLSCPIDRDAAPALRAKYGPYFNQLVNLAGQGVMPPLFPLTGFSIFPFGPPDEAPEPAAQPRAAAAAQGHPH